MHKIVLASASPRRREILDSFVKDYQVMVADIDEKIHDGERPEEVAMALAFEKAWSVSRLCKEDDIVIAADTIVVKDSILGKPIDRNDAFRMLSTLSDTIHFVITGIAVVQAGSSNKVLTFSETKVKIKQLTEDAINRYIDTGEVWDKAGSYAIQGKGSAFVEWIEGDYLNVVGLPISKLSDLLKKHFNMELY